MSSDNMQRQMDFMLEQQAQFNEKMVQLEDKMIQLEDKQRQNTEDITRLVGAVMNLTIHVQELVEHGKQTYKRSDELVERGKETNERLNTLILVVERYSATGRRANQTISKWGGQPRN